MSTCGPELLRFAAALLRSPDCAEDAFAESCEKIWSGLPSFAGRSSFRTWAFTVVRRVCFDQLRSPRARRQVPLSAAGPLSGIAAQVRTATAPFLRTDAAILYEADGESAGATESRKREAALRKKLERLEDRLRELARKEGLLDRDR